MTYFSLTLIITALMTFLPPIFLDRILANGVSIPAYVSTPLLLLFCFLVMFSYGYMITKKSSCKPSTKAGLYAPLVTPLIWYLFNTGICNVLNRTEEILAALLGFWTLHIFGIFIAERGMQIPGCDMWHSILLWNLIYDSVLILGFTLGERLSAKKKNEPRMPFSYQKKIS